jgi:hypothetical protein
MEPYNAFGRPFLPMNEVLVCMVSVYRSPDVKSPGRARSAGATAGLHPPRSSAMQAPDRCQVSRNKRPLEARAEKINDFEPGKPSEGWCALHGLPGGGPAGGTLIYGANGGGNG